ncbi:hypothetical protein BV133_1695 [Blastochloris viridis]|uniref:Uncharacterized protein n=1 Tax=Blastochloris viridis TaxID=1079 RepID=A0A182D1Q6_BLAVI|nr:hypothetical protein BV133_1695 [Blastochloris viridis]
MRHPRRGRLRAGVDDSVVMPTSWSGFIAASGRLPRSSPPCDPAAGCETLVPASSCRVRLALVGKIGAVPLVLAAGLWF